MADNIYYIDQIAVTPGLTRMVDDSTGLDQLGFKISDRQTTASFIDLGHTAANGVATSAFARFTDAQGLVHKVLVEGLIEVARGSFGSDLILGNSADNFLFCGWGTNPGASDTLRGNAGHDSIFAGTGNDDLFGGIGNDDLRGNDGRDELVGGKGKDRLTGGLGSDTMTGGLGRDRFIFEGNGAESTVEARGRDVITDFSKAQHDHLQFTGFDGNTRQAGVQQCRFLGEAGPDGAAAALWFTKAGGITQVFIDRNGDRTADFAVTLNGEIALTAADFFL